MPDLPPSPAPAAQADAAERPKPGDTYVQSFARGLAVIRSFSAEAPTQTLTEVATRTGLTRAGARRILLTLEGLGYVEAQGRQFRLTPKILDLGFAYLSSLPLWNLAEPVMETLVAEVKESCSAAVLDGAELVYVLRVPTHKIMRINLGIGSRLPAFCTSMGRVLLAGLPPEEARARLASRERLPWTSRTVVELEALVALVEETRRQGWCLVNQELEEGLVSLAAPIVDRTGRTIAALNISGQANRTPPAVMVERFLPLLLQASRDIARLLQFKT
ncbi:MULTISPECIES: IclR family transcriptional regulator C-terminal domain-containing protein [Aquincola]|uniref:IclR family transcriptional regulator domain-containing protein n=1 Tax=Aquincola TaxID=391952 RepID=UPI000614AEFF|nr:MULTISPECIES: IclR family transcriptional regulator C-terminal domain-containing protein [Aquincola]MCR5864012.1 helix-turn-helix domain-containing protein [Aquincola sp. J276]